MIHVYETDASTCHECGSIAVKRPEGLVCSNCGWKGPADAPAAAAPPKPRRLPAERERLGGERRGTTHKFTIRAAAGTTKGYLTVGMYPDGRPGELFLKLDRAGDAIHGFADAWAIAVSVLLQTGTPLEVICAKFRGMRFEPAGLTDNPDIRVALSPLDYVARWLALKFIPAAKENP